MNLYQFASDVEAPVLQQMTRCLSAEPDARGVLCADNHLGYSMPIGGVVAYRGHLSPSAVGYDIACGNMAVRLDCHRVDVNIPKVMDDIVRHVSFGMGRANNEPVDHEVLGRIATAEAPIREHTQRAASQLGTVGSGNHYVDLLEDEQGYLWIGVHFGSRGFGHKFTTWVKEQLGQKNDAMDAPPLMIPIGTDLAQLYVMGMTLAGDYAYAGREWVVAKVRTLIGAKVTDVVHNHHNFAWYEKHGGEWFWVHRKGATPAWPGQRGFIGGSMGDIAVIACGIEHNAGDAALRSTVHGAGRVMGRKQAAGVTKLRKQWRCGQRDCGAVIASGLAQLGPDGSNPRCRSCGGKMHKHAYEERVRPGLVDFAAVQAQMRAKGIELRGAGADEAPECYRPLSDVLDQHGGTIVIEHMLRPVGVAMAGPGIVDPYKD